MITLILGFFQRNPLMIVVIALLALSGFLKVQVWHYKTELAQQQTMQAKAIAQAAQEVLEIQAAQNEITTGVTRQYENNLKTIRDRYKHALDGMLDNYDGNLPQERNAARKPFNYTRADRFSESDARFLIGQAYNCELNTETLVALQTWVKKQHALNR